MKKSQAIIFFDGVCVFCNRSVSFILSRDASLHFRYAALQGQTARELIPQQQQSLDTIAVFIEGSGITLVKAEAVLYILEKLSGPISLLRFLRVIPIPLLNTLYDGIAQLRYRIFGVQSSCDLPAKTTRSRFLP